MDLSNISICGIRCRGCRGCRGIRCHGIRCRGIRCRGIRCRGIRCRGIRGRDCRGNIISIDQGTNASFDCTHGRLKQLKILEELVY